MLDHDNSSKNAVNHRTEIALISPTIELSEKTKEIIENIKSNIEVFTLDSKVDAVEDALRIARVLAQQGTKVIISRKGTAVAIRNAKIEVEVVIINTVLSDYVEALKTAKQYEGLIAFFSYDEMTDDIKAVCRMIGLSAKFYTFKADKDCEILIKQALKEGAVLGIGGCMNQKYADLYGLEHITIENTENSIINAIETANQILMVKKDEFKKQRELQIQLERHKAILNFTHDAIIATDENGIISVINPIAERIVKVSSEYAVGKHINSIIKDTKMFPMGESQLNELIDINGTLVSANRIPIKIENQIKGIVATFQDVRIIQEDENRIRRNIHKKGLFAKYNFSDIIGESASIKSTIRVAKSYGLSDATILIQGESGTGKELFVQSIHNISDRKDGPFVAINCAALSKNLLESELFGYDEGAFTGASKGGKTGLFELAHNGTIFLDEIAEIPIETQAKLLRVLQEKEIRKIGSDVKTPVDVRVMAATNKDLKEEIRMKRFREDLYYRICVLNLIIPPLREREDDVKLLAIFFLEKFLCIKDLKYQTDLNNIIEKVKDYKWYGNVRELENYVKRISVFLQYHGESPNYNNKIIESVIIDNSIESNDEKRGAKIELNINERKKLEQFEVNQIIKTLKQNNLSIQNTADSLGISRTTLWRKMKKYNL